MVIELSPQFFGQPEMNAQDALHTGIIHGQVSSQSFSFPVPAESALLVLLWIMNMALAVVFLPCAPRYARVAAEATCPAL